jgi:polysaccharide chain length determinant protein (PEP-CTERM system associated)
MSTNERPRGSAPAGYLDGEEDDSFNWNRFRHLLHAPLRRPLMVLVPWASILLLSIAALFVLPKKYKSSTLILVESEKVPDSFVANIATQSRGRSLDTIKPEILSRTRLERVLQETQPFPEIASETRAVEVMRAATSVNSSGSDGFTIEFVHKDPHKAQQVTDRLTTLFIEETIKSREQQVEGAVDFLVAQVNDARGELEKKDEALRQYKEGRMGRLPEQLQTNLATMGMLQQEMRTVEESLVFARERQEALARGAARSLAPGGSGSAATGTDDVAALRSQLATLRARYTDEHPDVQSLRTRIARIEARLAAIPADNGTGAVDASTVNREQLDRANLEIRKLEDRRADLESRIAAIRTRVDETPRTEQELANLKRDYDKLNENYVALLSKQLEAQMAGRLEQRWKGDRFRVLDPASLPERPYSPKPLPIVGLGVILGLLVGLGAALVAEHLDPTVKDSEDLQGLLDYPILARIPHLSVLNDTRTR